MAEDLALVKVSLDVEEARRFVRAIVAEELAKLPGAGMAPVAEPAWMTPPKAAKACGVSTKRVRALLRRGLVEKRLRNVDAEKLDPADPHVGRRRKWEINVDSLKLALGGGDPRRPGPGAPIDATAWARARVARGGK